MSPAWCSIRDELFSRQMDKLLKFSDQQAKSSVVLERQTNTLINLTKSIEE